MLGQSRKDDPSPHKILLNKLIKCINFKPFRYSEVNNLFMDNKILQVDDIFNLELGKFLYKFSHNQLPVIFFNYFTKLSEIHDYNTRIKHSNFYLERPNTKMGLNSLQNKGATLWKTISLNTKQSTCYSEFCTMYRKELLAKYQI